MGKNRPQPLQTPTLGQVLETALDSRLLDVHTVSWGTVQSFDPATGTASVQLIPRQTYYDDDGARQTEARAPLLSVPVMFPGSGDYSITFPVKAGDVVLVVFAEDCTDAWVEGGQEDTDTGDDRRHSLSDAFCIPGLRPKSKPIAGPPPQDALVVNAPKICLGDKDASKPPALNDDVASIVNVLTTWAPVSGDGGAALRAAMRTAFPSPPTGDSVVKLKG